jgi:putative phage-type endonuclease
MKILSVTQGSQQWLDARRNHLTASEAPIALGVSKYATRTDLLNQKSTGIEKEIDAYKQSLFDQGHASEAGARSIAEEIIGQELYPITGTSVVDGLSLLASLDGATMDEEVIWEHKLFGEDLAEAVRAGNLDPHYTVQMDQQLLVSGAKKCLFMTSDGTPENMAWCWYESSQEKFDALIAGWKRFAADLAEYVPQDIPEKPKADAIMALPALAVQIRGEVITSNLPVFRSAAETFIANIKTDLKTDDDFVQADATVKFCKEAEDNLEVAKNAAIAQTASIDELMRTVDHIREQLRTKRLALNSLVEQRKKQIKENAVAERRQKYADHVAALNTELGEVSIVVAAPDFVAAIKGLKTIASLYDKLDTALANGKIAADAAAKDLRAKLDWHKQHAEYAFLFRDLQTLIQKPTEDFQLAVTTRIEQHKQAEAEKEAKAAVEKAAAIPAPQTVTLTAPGRGGGKTASAAPTSPPTLRLGQINERLAPIALSAEGLATLGFKHAATDKAAKLYHEGDFELICAALVRHVQSALRQQAA